MPYRYDKNKILDQIPIEDMFQIVSDLGGNPSWNSTGFVSETICHNPPGEGSHKLYYYDNGSNSQSRFYCYTGCDNPSMDLYGLIMKVAEIQWNMTYSLHDAILWVVGRLGIAGEVVTEQRTLQDAEVFEQYEEISDVGILNIQDFRLKPYDDTILRGLNYHTKIKPWLDEGISQEAIEKANIGYYPVDNAITIPHYDMDGNFIGLRGRFLSQDDAAQFGKYRPLKINGKWYSHQLGWNLYGLNWNRIAISSFKQAIVVESEKAVLMGQTYMGDGNICVACCGSSISELQIQQLMSLGINDLCIALDRQYKEVGDEEYEHWRKKMWAIYKKIPNMTCNVWFLWDKEHLLDYKDSPLDKGKEVFLKLYEQRKPIYELGAENYKKYNTNFNIRGYNHKLSTVRAKN